MAASDKQRLDLAVFSRGLAASRQRARALIMSGKVLVNRKLIDKPGVPVAEQDEILLKGDDHPFVSRGGLKLEAALQAFEVVVANKVCLDVGASTGGFTDCLSSTVRAKFTPSMSAMANWLGNYDRTRALLSSNEPTFATCPLKPSASQSTSSRSTFRLFPSESSYRLSFNL